MEVKTWQGGTYGIRVGKKNANDYFNKSWDCIEVKYSGPRFLDSGLRC